MAKETAVQTASTAVKNETKYSLEKLRANCKSFSEYQKVSLLVLQQGLQIKNIL